MKSTLSKRRMKTAHFKSQAFQLNILSLLRGLEETTVSIRVCPDDFTRGEVGTNGTAPDPPGGNLKISLCQIDRNQRAGKVPDA